MEFDHLFICASPTAREADCLAASGLMEGSPNTHPGQSTTCHRFFFQNAYIELLWVEDQKETQLETTRPTTCGSGGLVERVSVLSAWAFVLEQTNSAVFPFQLGSTARLICPTL